MRPKLASFVNIVRADPAVENVVAFTGGQQRNTGMMFVQLKPLSERKTSAWDVVNRLRPQVIEQAHGIVRRIALDEAPVLVDQQARAAGRSRLTFRFLRYSDSKSSNESESLCERCQEATTSTGCGASQELRNAFFKLAKLFHIACTFMRSALYA